MFGDAFLTLEILILFLQQDTVNLPTSQQEEFFPHSSPLLSKQLLVYGPGKSLRPSVVMRRPGCILSSPKVQRLPL